MARLTKEDRIASIDATIAKKQQEIEELKKKKYDLEHPLTAEAVVAAAKKSGMSPKEMAEKLGVEV